MIGIDRRASPRVLDELISQFYLDYPLTLSLAVVTAGICVVLLWAQISAAYLISWFCSVCGASVLQALEYRSHRRRGFEIAARARVMRLVALSICGSIAWGSGGLAVAEIKDGLSLIFAFLVLMGVITVSANALVPIPIGFFAMLPFISLPAVYSLAHATSTEWLFGGIGLITILASLSARYCWTAHASLVTSILLRFENAELVEDLRAQKARAEDSELAKSRFLAAASHDLRQPIGALKLYTEALRGVLAGGGESQDAARISRQVDRSVEAMSGIIDGVLDLSKIEAGMEEPALEVLRLSDLFQRLENDFAAAAAQKKLRLKVRTTDMLVRSDPAMLYRILTNFVTNAITYTQNGGVLVADRRQRNVAVIEVWDSGVGIPADHHQHVFEEYFQIGNPARSRGHGLGLGLAIVRGLCDLLDIEIQICSRVGKGSRFRLLLPQQDAPLELAARPQTNISQASVGSNKNILIVDDDPLSLDALELCVAQWGFGTMTADSVGDIARQPVATAPPDLILSDFRLPDGKTAFDVLAQVAEHTGRRPPMIMITGETDPKVLAQAVASHHLLLHKPVAPGKLRAAINASI